VTWYLKPWCMPGEVMTDMYYPIYADGLYEALMQVRVGVCWSWCLINTLTCFFVCSSGHFAHIGPV
jgi:hypothetical protein